jgi:hypothetical protein
VRPGDFLEVLAAFAVFDHFSAPAQRANLCYTGDYSTFHSHAKLKLLIGIMPIRIDGELHHGFPSCSPAA